MRLILATIVATWLVLATVEAAVAERMVLALGDSLTAGYGLPEGQGWPELVRERLKSAVDERRSSGYPSYIGDAGFRAAAAGWMQRRWND